ncbi:hypothetical protein TNCV_1408571 [Trichonephila clavipes]|uniref:Uncharacterized protein n=1 Tax=Trichonephila clavipes TaxID=2585209 RepID=A0A8X6UWY6_TRICX|nr:hypothetical protein TNCV_1408571 [Trichonephila clavipes]
MPDIEFIISKLKGVLPSLLSWIVHIKNIGDRNLVRNENLSVSEECISEKEDVEEKMENNMNEYSLKINNNKHQEISEVNPAIPKVVEELPSKTVEITREKSKKEEQNQNKVENKYLPQEKDEITVSRKSVDKVQSTSFNNDMDFIKEIIFNLMAEEREFFAEEYSKNDNKNKWILNVETMDGDQFAIPFENGKETFGSKFVACSPVFQAMLKHPMQERFHKVVKFLDIHR